MTSPYFMRRLITNFFRGGYIRITSGYSSLRSLWPRWRFLSGFGMDSSYWFGSTWQEGTQSYPFLLRILCYLAWSLARVRRSWHGFVYRSPERYLLLVSSLILSYSLFFMPSAEQMRFIANGVGLFQRVFCKTNLILLVPLIAIISDGKRR